MGQLEKGEGGASLPSPVEAYQLFVPGIKGLLVKTRKALDDVSIGALEDSKDLFVDPEESSYVEYREEEEGEIYKPLYALIKKILRSVRDIKVSVRNRDGFKSSEVLLDEFLELQGDLYRLSPHFSRLDSEQKKNEDHFDLIPSSDDVDWSPEKESDEAVKMMGEDMKEIFGGLKKVLQNAEAFVKQYL